MLRHMYKIRKDFFDVKPFSLIITILIFMNLMLQEDAFSLNMRGIWIYIIDLIILIVTLVDLIRKKNRITTKEIRETFRFLVPFVIIIIYSVIVNLITNKMPLDEILIAGLYWIIPILMAIIFYLDVYKEGIDIIFNAILLNYFAVILKCISINGFFYLLKLSTYTNNFGSLLEVHTIGLSLPLFLIYYIFQYYENKIKLRTTFWIGILFTFMCGKRIVLIAIIVVLFSYFLLKNTPRKLKKRRLYLFIFIIFISSFLYLIIVKYDFIQYLSQLIGINTMSRVETWGALKEFYVISPIFPGNGVGFSTYYLKNLDGIYINGFLNKVGDVHNDILKNYIDLGFFMFLYYMWSIIVGNIIYFIRKRCHSLSMLYFLLMFYTIILMLVDNIMRYDLYLLTFFLIILTYKKSE